MDNHRDIMIKYTPDKAHKFEIYDTIDNVKKTIYTNLLAYEYSDFDRLAPGIAAFFKAYSINGHLITISKDYEVFPRNNKTLYKVIIGLPPCTMELCLESIATETN